MEFPAKIGKKYTVQIPKNIRSFEDLREGDQVIIRIEKKESVETSKIRIEEPWARLSR
jgi:AbrB family looped-hinge helix DNA binding protein